MAARVADWCIGALILVAMAGWWLAAQGKPDGPLCPAVGAVARPESTPEEVCGKVPSRGSHWGVVNKEELEETARCWNVVTTAWERYYQCGGQRDVATDGGAP